MADEREREDLDRGPAVREEGASPMRLPSKPRRKWPYIMAGVFVGIPLAVIALWTAISLNWTYSEGVRSGFVQKFSHKGWVCKTWEGEIAMVNMPGPAQEKFLFTVRDDSVAAEINKVMGSRVTLTYEEHVAIPTSCFGETSYFVTGVKALP